MEDGIKLRPEEIIEGINQIQNNTGNKNTIQGELFESNLDKTYNVKVTDDRGVEIILWNRKSSTDISFVVNDTLDTASSLSLQVNLDCPDGDIDRSVITGFSGYNLPKEPTVRHFSTALAIDTPGLYVIDVNAKNIIALKTSLELCSPDVSFLTSEYMGGDACNDGTYLYICSLYGTYDIYKYTLAGNLETSFGVFHGNATGIATDGTYIFAGSADTTGYPAIYRYNVDGSGGTYIAITGTGNGEFRNPAGMAIKSNGNLLIADKNNNRVQEITTTGAYVSQFASADNPRGLCIDSLGQIYTVDYIGKLRQFSSTGTLLNTWTTCSNVINYLSIDSEDNIYAPCGPLGKLYKYNTSGSKLAEYSITNPRGITIL